MSALAAADACTCSTILVSQLYFRHASRAHEQLIVIFVRAQVLKVLQSAPALAALLKGAEAALAPPGLLHRTPEARHESAGFADLVPWLTDQAQEWAAVACATLDTSAPPAVRPCSSFCRSFCLEVLVLVADRHQSAVSTFLRCGV